MSAIAPVTLAIPDAALVDLERRLEATRWPERETVDDWSQGAPLADMQALVHHWTTYYDWRRCERMINAFGLYRTEIDGLQIQFLHVRSPHQDAMPLLLTHGWPGSIIEFHKVIEPLVDPVAFGADAGHAFDVVVPCLPGYGFSGKPDATGWNTDRIARAWVELMRRLGYDRYVAQGGDWGAVVTIAMGKLAPEPLAGIHLNMPLVTPRRSERGTPGAEEQAALDALQVYMGSEAAYARLQGTRPQTLGYGLADSPVGQAAWIYEKFKAWSDCGERPETLFTRDELLDNIMLYWLTGAGASSARLYWESFGNAFAPTELDLPVGCSLFPKEIVPAARSWAERYYRNIIHWNRLERGGHFAAFEQPALFVQELRDCFAKLR